MDEQSEILKKPEVVVPPELEERMRQATSTIEGELQKPDVQVARGTEQMGMFAELGKLAKDTTVRRLGVMFKDAKAALGIIPFINKVSEAITPTESLGKLVGRAAGAEQDVARAESAVKKTSIAAGRANEKFMKMPDSVNPSRLEEASINAGTKLTEQFAAEDVLKEKLKLRKEKVTAVTERMGQTTINTDEKWASRQARKLAGIHTDSDFVRRYEGAKAWGEDMQKRGKISKPLTEGELMLMAANGELPSKTKMEALGRRAKGAGAHMLLRTLGPIIDPVPDVPPLVTMASYGSELLGFVWGGLIPPAWQYLHNRYEDFMIGVDTSKKAMEIVRRHWGGKMNTLEEARVTKAAGVFSPKKEFAQSV